MSTEPFDLHPLPRVVLLPWPRGMRASVAARYLGISESAFRRVVGSEIKSVLLMPSVRIWLKDDVDAWLDRKAGKLPETEPPNPWDE